MPFLGENMALSRAELLELLFKILCRSVAAYCSAPSWRLKGIGQLLQKLSLRLQRLQIVRLFKAASIQALCYVTLRLM
jgi:hypothetical protein